MIFHGLRRRYNVMNDLAIVDLTVFIQTVKGIQGLAFLPIRPTNRTLKPMATVFLSYVMNDIRTR